MRDDLDPLLFDSATLGNLGQRFAASSQTSSGITLGNLGQRIIKPRQPSSGMTLGSLAQGYTRQAYNPNGNIPVPGTRPGAFATPPDAGYGPPSAAAGAARRSRQTPAQPFGLLTDSDSLLFDGATLGTLGQTFTKPPEAWSGLTLGRLGKPPGPRAGSPGVTLATLGKVPLWPAYDPNRTIPPFAAFGAQPDALSMPATGAGYGPPPADASDSGRRRRTLAQPFGVGADSDSLLFDSRTLGNLGQRFSKPAEPSSGVTLGTLGQQYVKPSRKSSGMTLGNLGQDYARRTYDPSGNIPVFARLLRNTVQQANASKSPATFDIPIVDPMGYVTGGAMIVTPATERASSDRQLLGDKVARYGLSGLVTERTAQQPTIGVAEDIAKAVPAKLARGAANVAGTLGTIKQSSRFAQEAVYGQTLGRVDNYLDHGTWEARGPSEMAARREAFYDMLRAKKKELEAGLHHPVHFYDDAADILTPENAQKVIERVTGPLYEPQTVPGQYAGTIAEFVPETLAGPENLLKHAPETFLKHASETFLKRAAKRTAQVVVPAVTSETAGQFTKGTALEPFARKAGKFLAKSALDAALP